MFICQLTVLFFILTWVSSVSVYEKGGGDSDANTCIKMWPSLAFCKTTIYLGREGSNKFLKMSKSGKESVLQKCAQSTKSVEDEASSSWIYSKRFGGELSIKWSINVSKMDKSILGKGTETEDDQLHSVKSTIWLWQNMCPRM